MILETLVGNDKKVGPERLKYKPFGLAQFYFCKKICSA